jgi:general L-amino acid transport system permease protein
MADLSPKLSKSGEDIPFWRDGRVLGVFAQIIFLVLVIMATAWLANNVVMNMERLGAFRCADGTSRFACGFNFLRIDAQFDLGETTLISYEPSDSFARAILVGGLNTLRVGVFGVILATILGTLTGIARLSDNWLISNIAKWYVDLIRNTPLLLQLFFIYFGVILLLPPIRQAIQPFGLPVFISQRGIDIISPTIMISGRIWVIALIIGFVAAVVLGWALRRRAIEQGKASPNGLIALTTFVVIAAVGWFIAAGTGEGNQSLLTQPELGVTELSDLADLVAQRLGVTDLAGVSAAVSDGRLTQEQVNEATLTVCALVGDRAEINLAAELRRLDIPYRVQRFTRTNLAVAAFTGGNCDVFAGDNESLTAVTAAGASGSLIPVRELPVRFSYPAIEGLNFVGGYKLTPNFAAILLGLVLYTGAFIAEIVRAGIQSVPKGQSEAARALGLSESQRLQLVVLPQALRVIVPPMTSQYLNLVKNSSLAIAVGYPDLWVTSFITMNQSGQAVQVFMIVMATYLSFSLLISSLLNWYNQRIALVER